MTTAPISFIPSRRLPMAETGGAPKGPEAAFDPSGARRVFWTASARSALRAMLLHLRSAGSLPDKNAEVLVPRWACAGLYNTVHKVAFPTIADSSGVRGVLAYHQYGFPQRLDRIAQRCRDRGLFLIENNVNCVFDGVPIGGMGEAGMASMFSLPKMFSTSYGGALVTRDPGLIDFCKTYFQDDEAWIMAAARVSRRIANGSSCRAAARLHEMVYSAVDYCKNAAPDDLARLRADIASGCVARRRRNYALLRKEFSDTPFFEGLESDVVPFVAPLFGPADFLRKLAAALSRDGWESGVYHFDAARDLFEPRFVECVPLPVRHDLTGDETGRLIEVVRREWRAHDGQR